MARTCVLQWGIKITMVSAAREVGLEFHLELVISVVTLLCFVVVIFELVFFFTTLALISFLLEDIGTS